MIMSTAPKRRPSWRGPAARVAATALGVLALTASVPAQAAAPAATPAKPYGTVTAVSGLNQRMFPSTDSAVKGTLRHGAKVGLVCRVRAQAIAGNDLWYLVRDARRVWVPARYVAATGSVKYCKDVLV
ncbi:SH3 domain-containing protein [Streptomyces sp. C10-9-1]|uniref:SH3 domain-containing protein n=1 Tax=Streptomyces sp. C10-9-1 TaxID=1859285 RepID=UPI0021136674|nr:SH3 domain-containing protein [Streptomyces sp. C10-9-1]MCQ6553304.1 SH3 domain-containing protein [Streptomyces sp. C10-9-1]